ncbi:MAG: phosphatase PAP2 family protein [Candidatus Eremiobacteraeota bacterium]|nr:phosphatase PAP2 family protein [Candidatus Eremiobacteraeota bacterium]
MTEDLRLWFVAAACFAVFFALGIAVTHTTAFIRFDALANAVAGRATPLAILFTTSGRALPLLAAAVVGISIAALTRYNIVAAIAIFAMQLLSQAAIEGLKHVFHRGRPDKWIVHQDLGFSYPSGHAATAVVFYGSWLLLVLFSPLPKITKIAFVVVLATWMIGIDWSRLALGAHYPTDLIGGTLFGAACTCILWAMLLHVRAFPA